MNLEIGQSYRVLHHFCVYETPVYEKSGQPRVPLFVYVPTVEQTIIVMILDIYQLSSGGAECKVIIPEGVIGYAFLNKALCFLGAVNGL